MSRTVQYVSNYLMWQVGLKTLMDDGKVFECYESIHDTIFYSELGSSLAMLRAGFNIESLMMRYRGVDWRNESNWNCNAGYAPCSKCC